MLKRRRPLLTSGPYEQATEERFERVNRARLDRVVAALPGRQQEFLQVVPLLFHCNHPNLPGYVSGGTPCGIFNYAPSERALRAARQLSMAFAPNQRALPRHYLYGLYLIGSVGTIGQSRSSDFDLWLCHRDDLPPDAAAELVDKASAIERYAEELGLEVHFFVFSPRTFRDGRSLSLSTESSGSSQHYLLLDEFYRSGLVLAGVNPFWWRVPPERETDYENFRSELAATRALHAHDYADFGGMTHVPVNEFFGAALWQLSKSIDSPHKSVLKLLLMEAYAAGYPNTTLLSHRYKQLIHEGVTDLEALDPYILMYRAAEQYLRETDDYERLEVLRRAFYHKVGEPLSRPVTSVHHEWRRAILQGLVAEWGWRQAEIRHLDEREHWPIEAVGEERRALVACFKKSYHILSEVARRHADARITRQDLTVLGRKLYAAFERKSGKIEIINHGISELSFEPMLEVLYRVTGGPDTPGAAGVWELLRPSGAPGKPATQLKRSASLVSLVAWAYLNRVASPNTHWQLTGSRRPLSDRDFRFLHETIFAGLKAVLEGKPKVSAYTRKARIDKCLVLINVGRDPMAGHSAKGRVLTSSNNDAFEFGGTGRNLVKKIDLLVRTTWGEYFYHQFDGDDAIAQTAALLTKWQFAGSGIDLLEIRCASEAYQAIITERAYKYLLAAMHALGQHRGDALKLFVTRIGGRPTALARTEDGARAAELRHLGELESFLDELPGRDVHVAFDREYFRADAVATSLGMHRPGRWQLFTITRREHTDLAIIDDVGRPFVERRLAEPAPQVVAHYLRFLVGIRDRRLREETLEPGAEPVPIDTVRLEQHPDGSWFAAADDIIEPVPGSYLEVKVVGQMRAGHLTEVVLICGDMEFSSTDHGARVYEIVAAEVLAHRETGAAYSIYVTDMDIRSTLSEAPGSAPAPLPRLLRYKQGVEQRLDRALNGLIASG